MAADVDSEIEAAEKRLKESEEAFDDRIKGQQADDRSHIAKLIVWAFVILLGFVVVAVIAALFFFSGDWDKIAEPAKVLVTLLSSVLLPVVTLVIGYYFGSK